MAKVLGFTNSPPNECSGLISFRIDWFDLPAVPGPLQESSPTPQFESINSSMLSLLYGSTLTSIHLLSFNEELLFSWTLREMLSSE